MVPPITSLTAPEQQHMLLLFLPVKNIGAEKINEVVISLKNAVPLKSAAGQDQRAAAGVHFFMIYHLPAGKTPNLPVPSFQTSEGKGLLVVQALYDADFEPYISAFVENEKIAKGLDGILHFMDETGLVSDDDPISAANIIAAGGVQYAPGAFNCLLMRYNFGDPTLPASTMPKITDKYLFSGTFPGLTVGKILQNYPDAPALWPATPEVINFDQSASPGC